MIPLERLSYLSVSSLRQILGVSDGMTAIIFKMIRELAIDTINSGEEHITDEATAVWKSRGMRHLG